MSDVLRCAEIRKSYGGVAVLHGVSLGVAEGEILGLVGANGAGKTTLIDIIAGQQEADSGEIRLGAHKLSGLRPSAPGWAWPGPSSCRSLRTS